MRKILMTGGGTAGHVTPNIALFPSLRKNGFEIFYIGTESGIEKKLIEQENIPYFSIKAGKLRRYFDIKNITDISKISKGYFQALSIIHKIKPNIVFSKGGFVSSPVVWAAWTKRIPVIIHESDITPGLANKISIPFSKSICYSFPETINYLPKDKSKLTGIPVRQNLFQGNKNFGKKLCSFDSKSPIVLIIGGSLGSQVLNNIIRSSLQDLLKNFQICHICGKGNFDLNLKNLKGYKQFEYVSDELPHLFAAADIIISRAGATTLNEILALKKPNILIPLSKQASRGDQILNAESYKKHGFSFVIREEELNVEKLIDALKTVYNERNIYVKNMSKSNMANGIEEVMNVILENVK
ncbi:undecaprenyldiphospho-muramoylpentapeptide beta-N-acetylglucosaminyltransferase [Garciella nitratireducens]|uniref:UDP-N-acetylglucosamine--N-acetylmuramyl-(pentapeptide) pyrophosphoryl-undecaprenol N-acetylglucosamine transferase n=1 Tax=Garciella nitratireducens DSM 15102 TaxID=1121911 RepID=A0A1T4JZ06_9FIRM|nr:undecaprenyldiphospho-muramoylpentapeptide beta-N-acetylglucosaminyltransferase [Garciella nitratireducens]RBP41122.1 UDP-N-acetylglucosamine-N-acetylmuramylpentapeptide N-acetylglucosamine transferase [Garciella nitratireducens]SJZ35275.1 UDP-N-acetylglucosamine-N-acetylmuramylpentapeptide N-acetylglucosamine transferase [Garciella nitratireducens DSM 15102]